MQATKEKNQVKSFEIDFKGRMSIVALINNMQEAAWNNAESLGASVARLQTEGISWVLTRFNLEIDRFPKHREHYFVESWPTGGKRTFVYRDYRIYDTKNLCIARATSTWLVFDLKTRKMIKVPQRLEPLISTPRGKDAMPIASGKITPVSTNHLPHRFPVRWHDVDTNKHMSNVYYFQCAVEAMPDDILNQKELSRIDLNFRAECSWNDILLTNIAQDKDGSFLHTIRRESDEKILALVRSYWS